MERILKPAITDIFGHLEATETNSEHNINIISPFKLLWQTLSLLYRMFTGLEYEKDHFFRM